MADEQPQETPAAAAAEQEEQPGEAPAAPEAAASPAPAEDAEAPAEPQQEAPPDDAPAEKEGTPAPEAEAGEGETAPLPDEGGEGAAGEAAEAPAAEGEGAEQPPSDGDAAPAAEGEEESGVTAPPEGDEQLIAPEQTEGEAAAAGQEGGEGQAASAEGESAAPDAGQVLAEGGEPAEEDEAPAAEGAAEGEKQKAEGEESEPIPQPEETEEREEEEKEEQEDFDDEPIPQSETFAEGERAESPVAVGEKLSREGTPTPEDADPAPHLRPESPRDIGTADTERSGHVEYEDEEDEEEEEEPEFDRDALIERYHAAMAERDQLTTQNYQLQNKLADHFKRKKQDDGRQQEVDRNVTDQEQRYLKYMSNLEELRNQDLQERDTFKEQIEELRGRCQERQQRVDAERLKYLEFKKAVAMNSVNSRSGRTIPPYEIDQHLGSESKKESEVVNVRLENIKLKNKLKKAEQQLKSKEELADGLHLIDFEQLKIENQTYNEKIEERNEELLKLRKKITSTVQMLTHLKEKLQFVQGENNVQRSKLREVEELASRKRDILTKTKQARDALRIDNHRLRHNCGLLGNEPLLRDFEERKDEADDLRDRLEHLRMEHAELTLNCNAVRKKIEIAKKGR